MKRINPPSQLPATPRLCVALALVGLMLSSALGAQYFGKNKIRYEEFDWKTYESAHFTVYYYSKVDPNLEKVVSLAESAYDQLSRDFDFQIQERTPLILYATHSEFLQNNLILNFIPEGVGAFATSARFRMVLPIDLPDIELYELILHELTHIFEYHILFNGSLGRSLTLNPPTWLMEGLASYMAKDESTSDKMFLRDAVVNDTIPPITQSNVQGFFAYRFGHAAFDFMEERWGRDGVLDFLFEFRNTIGARVGRAIERAFRIEPEDFDIEFRRWLRRRYLPELVATGEPSDFGRPFRTERGNSQELAPVSSPSGDLVASFSTLANDLDIVLFNTESRRPLRNLTKGYSTDFRNFVAQHVSVPRKHGHDLAFSPDGNQVAAFVRKEAGYSLAIVNVLKGGVDRVIDMEVQQQTAPAWHPDGRRIAFSGNVNGQFDIFLLDLDSLEIRNLTNDDLFDGAPAFSPDGESMVFVSVPEEGGQLFRISLDDPSTRIRLTDDEFTNTDPTFSSDGNTLYFTSDRTGAENIFGLDLASRQLTQYTNAVTGCFMPTVLSKVGEEDRLVYTGYWKGRFDIYEAEIAEPIAVTQLDSPESTGTAEDFDRFVPDIQVTVDESAKRDKKGFKLFLEDAQTFAGVDDDQTVIGQVFLTFSDFLGDRRLFALFQSIESFSNFNVAYFDLSNRWQWSLSAFDDRTFFIGRNFFDGRIERGQSLFQQTGVSGGLTYPFSFSRRFEVNLAYIKRKIDFQGFAIDSDGNPILDDAGNLIPTIEPRDDDYPQLSVAFVSDNAIYGPQGPAAGHRVRLSGSYAPFLDAEDDQSSTLTSTIELDARKYFPLTRRSTFAVRLFASQREGDFPNPVYFGGLDTVRGFDFRDLVGDHAFFSNIELRFPLIDFFVTPILSFQGIQGRFFLDIAGAWFDDVQDFDFYDSDESRLEDGVASYGFGITVRLFGLDVNIDWAQTWDFEESGDSTSSFWIGQRF